LSSGDRDLDVIEGGVHAESVSAGSVPIRGRSLREKRWCFW
jgi:hypothetical protein